MQKHPSRRHQPKLFEGLRANDLDGLISPKFTVDQYKSKMGNDEDVAVIAFKVKDKFPAIDLMEFIEKGYSAVLDADMSTGEEKDGQYRVFVEFKRDRKLPEELDKLIKGISQLCKYDAWRFRFYKDADSHEFTKESIEKFIPLTAEDYKERIKKRTIDDIKEILNQGATDVKDIDESLNVTISKPYAGDLKFRLDAIGSYNELSSYLGGGLQLDESSNSQLLYLEKYLGNYEINKIDNKFLIRNKDKAIIISKDSW